MSYGASLKQPARPAAWPASPAPTPYPQVFSTPSPAHDHLLASSEALKAPVALLTVPASGECLPVFTVTSTTPHAPPILVPLPASPCKPRFPRVVANGSHRPLSPPSRRGEGDAPPFSGGGVPSNGLSPDDDTRGEVAHAESTAKTMVADVMRTGST